MGDFFRVGLGLNDGSAALPSGFRAPEENHHYESIRRRVACFFCPPREATLQPSEQPEEHTEQHGGVWKL